MGEAMPITPIPALTLSASTAQMSQNCGVRCASPSATFRLVIRPRVDGGGAQPSGTQPSGGTR